MDNLSNNKRIAKNTLFQYARMLLMMGVSLYTSRVILSVLGVNDYGIYSLVGGIVTMFSFINSSMASATMRFLVFELGKQDYERLKKTFSSTLTIHFIIAAIVLILGETVGLWWLENKLVIPEERMNAARWVYQLSIIGSMISITQVPYNAIIMAHEKFNIYAYVEILNSLLRLGIVYLLVIGNFDKLILNAVLNLCITIIITLIYKIYCIRNYAESHYQPVWEKEIIKPMLSFSGWDMMGFVAVLGSTQGLNILLNMFLGTAVNAARAISVQVNGAVNGFVNGFQVAVNPQIVKLYAAKKIEALHTLLFQNSKFSFCLIWLLSLPVFLKIETILNIWLTIVPEYTAIFCRLILLQSIVSCIQRPLVTACHAVGNIKMLQLSVSFFLLSVLPISYFLLKAGYPAYFPFIVYVIMTIVEYIIELVLLNKWIQLSYVQYLKKSLIPMFFVTISSLLLPLSLLYILDDSLLSSFIIGLVSVVSAALSAYCFALDKRSRKKILNVISNKIFKNK